jgi:predicted nuclease with RNAse H fold
MNIVGIDLAGVPSRRTGFCRILEGRVECCILYTYEDIIKVIHDNPPDLIAMDAPLSLPYGRCCLLDTCPCRGKSHLRACDRELLAMKIRFFPITLGPMRLLTVRGLDFFKTFSAWGFRTIEVYPGAAQDIWGIPRKQKGMEALKAALEKLGGFVLPTGLSHDELDAISCALVGKEVLEGKGLAIGDPKEGLMYLPKASFRHP